MIVSYGGVGCEMKSLVLSKRVTWLKTLPSYARKGKQSENDQKQDVAGEKAKKREARGWPQKAVQKLEEKD